MKEGGEERKYEISMSPGLWPSVCFCGYLPLHCLLRARQCAERVVVVGRLVGVRM